MKKLRNIGKFEILEAEKKTVFVCSYCGKSSTDFPIMIKESKYKQKSFHKECSETYIKELEVKLGIVNPNTVDSNETFSAPVDNIEANETHKENELEKQEEKRVGRILYKDKKIILRHPYNKEAADIYHRFNIKFSEGRWECNISRASLETCKFLLRINKNLSVFNWTIGKNALLAITQRFKEAENKEKEIFDKIKEGKNEIQNIDTSTFLKAEPFPYQRKGLEFLNSISGVGMIGDEMGLGKSFQAIAYATQHNLKTIVVCPATLKYNWKNEVEKFTDKKTLIVTEIAEDALVAMQTINMILEFCKAKPKLKTKDSKKFDKALDDTIKMSSEGKKRNVRGYNKLLNYVNNHSLSMAKQKKVEKFLKNQEEAKDFIEYIQELTEENEKIFEQIENIIEEDPKKIGNKLVAPLIKLNKKVKQGTIDSAKYFNDPFLVRHLRKYKRDLAKPLMEQFTDFNIINFEQLEKYQDILAGIKFDLVVIDESQYIKNTSAQRTKTVMTLFKKIPKRVLLSGTAIKNRPIELYAQLKFLYPKIFSNKHEFAVKYCNAVKTHFSWDYSGASNLKELYARIKPFYLRRVKKDVLTELPEKTITKLELEFTPEESRGYDKILQEYQKKIDQLPKTDGNLSGPELALLMKLRQFASHNKVKKVTDFVKDILNNNENKKVIVFANFKETQDRLLEELSKDFMCASLFSSYKDKKRQDEVDRFQNDPYVRVFVSSSEAGGVGITLTEADTVVFADLMWSPSNHKQAEDRAHRLGQKDPVFIYYMIYKDSIENNMWKSIGKKLNIISQALDGTLDDSIDKVRKEVFKDILGKLAASNKDK